MSVLELAAVTYRYPAAPQPALRDVTLAVAEDELVVVAGRSGSGKSTLLRAACGLVPHFHGGEFAGRVAVAGLDTREHGPGELAEHCGTLLQDPETQVVMGSVRAELAFPLENRGDSASAVARGVEEVALALGIEALLDRPTHELSGGELQRVALGAALAARPRLLVLDEPASQLDPVAGDELMSLLRRLNEEMGTAILLADHRLERCLPAADRLLVLDRGALVCDASPREFLAWAAGAAPELQTPAAALFAQAQIEPPPTGVKEARATLRRRAVSLNGAAAPARDAHAPSGSDAPALRFDRVWHEFPGGRAALKGISFAVRAGERVALMGRNGAGKSTLLRHARGLMTPTRGRVEAAGAVGLLLQHPGDYFVHDRVAEEADAATLALAGLDGLGERHPRDLSGGERQRLALAIVATGGDAVRAPAAICLDEPTRGMDRSARDALVTLLRELAQRGSAVLVATHDAELVAMFAQRVVMMGEGSAIADGSPSELLAGGWYFATETARILGGAGGALLPAEGAALLQRAGAAVA